MNPLTNVKNITKLNQIELERGTVDKKSWHDIYKESAWIFIGGLAYGLTEGDILSVFSQYGEIVNINLVRDKKTGKTKGFCFLCYANQKSTVLAVDNFNGIKVCGRTIRVDHVANYKPPKENENEDDITKQLKAEGCAPRPIKVESDSEDAVEKRKSKKVKKEKKKHKKHKRKAIKQEGAIKEVKVKKEKYDPGYAKYEFSGNGKTNQKAQDSESEDSESSSNESSDGYSSHLSIQESAKCEAARKNKRIQSGSDSNADEHNRSRADAHPKRDSRDVKQRHDSSSSSESAKPKNRHRTGPSKRERSESSGHQPSVSITMSLHLSEGSHRYRTSIQSKSFDSKTDEPNRSKTNAHNRSDVKRRHGSSSSDETAKPKKLHQTGSSKSERSEYSMHQSSVGKQKSPRRSVESDRYRTLQSKSKDSRNYDRSVSPTKDKYYSKHNHERRRRDSSPSSESTTYSKYNKVREAEKRHQKHCEDREEKDSHHKKYRDCDSSNNKEYYSSDKKYKQSYENGNGSPDPNKSKSHKHVSRSSRTEREK